MATEYVFKSSIILVLILSAGIYNSQARNQGVNPSYDLVNLRENSWEPYGIGGLGWLPDGRLAVVEWGGTVVDAAPTSRGGLFLLTGVMEATGPSTITREKIISNLTEPLGLEVVDGEIFIHQKGSEGSRIMRVWDSGNNNWQMETFAEGWANEQQEGSFWHSWPGGLVYKDGYFHFNFSSKLSDEYGPRPTSGERGSWLRLDRQTKQWEVMATGMRTNTSTFWGPWNTIWSVDVQGDWRPDNSLIHLQQGKHYGHNYGATPQKPEDPPTVYCPQAEQCNAPVGGIYLKTGPYAGQLIVGEHQQQTINRYFVERINSNNEFQGMVSDFSWGHQPNEYRQAFANRFIMGLDGQSIIYGCAGDESGWVAGPALGALVKMVPNGNIGFDVLAIRSLGDNDWEIEFTSPASPTAASSSNYNLTKWTTAPVEAYGEGARNRQGNVGVSSAVFVAGSNNTRVRLRTTGAEEQFTNSRGTFGWTIKFDMPGIRSQTGDQSLYDRNVFYTLKTFGPGTSPVPGCTNPSASNYNSSANDDDGTCNVTRIGLRVSNPLISTLNLNGSSLTILNESGEKINLKIYTINGTMVFAKDEISSEFVFSKFPKLGVYIVKLNSKSYTSSEQIIIH